MGIAEEGVAFGWLAVVSKTQPRPHCRLNPQPLPSPGGVIQVSTLGGAKIASSARALQGICPGETAHAKTTVFILDKPQET